MVIELIRYFWFLDSYICFSLIVWDLCVGVFIGKVGMVIFYLKGGE